MIGYVTVGTNDLPRAAKFYDAIAAEMGVARMMEFGNFIAWGAPGGAAGIAATAPSDGQPATVGNGGAGSEGQGSGPSPLPCRYSAAGAGCHLHPA